MLCINEKEAGILSAGLALDLKEESKKWEQDWKILQCAVFFNYRKI